MVKSAIFYEMIRIERWVFDYDMCRDKVVRP